MMLKLNARLLIISFLIILGAPVNAEFDEASMAKKIDQLVSKMTLEEKALLTSGRDAWSTQPIERLDIPYIWMADGPHGLRRAPTTDTWGYGNQAPATCFPTASALSASWDMELLEEVGAALGVESNALGVDLLLGPGINIKRSPLAGRNFEALLQFNQANLADPTSGEIHFNLGLALWNENKKEKAIKPIPKTLEINLNFI